MKIIELEYLSPEWHAYRAPRITASTMAGLLGHDTRRTALSEWARIRRGEVGQSSESPFSAWGLVTERAHLAWMRLDGVEGVEGADYIVGHPLDDRICCTPDGFALGRSVVVELKAPSGYTADEWRPSSGDAASLPMKYQIQAQVAMMCCGVSMAHLSALLPPKQSEAAFVGVASALLDRDFPVSDDEAVVALLRSNGFAREGFDLPANPRLHRAMEAEVRRFWAEHVEAGVAPRATSADVDKQTLKSLATGEMVADIDDEHAALFESLDGINAELKEIQARKDEAQNRLTQQVGAATWAEAKKTLNAARRLLA